MKRIRKKEREKDGCLHSKEVGRNTRRPRNGRKQLAGLPWELLWRGITAWSSLSCDKLRRRQLLPTVMACHVQYISYIRSQAFYNLSLEIRTFVPGYICEEEKKCEIWNLLHYDLSRTLRLLLSRISRQLPFLFQCTLMLIKSEYK